MLRICWRSDSQPKVRAKATGVLNPEGLRAPDECCRHKALGFIGPTRDARRAREPDHVRRHLYDILTFDELACRVTQALVS